MRCEKIRLKYYYNFLGEGGKDPTLQLFLPYNMVEMKRTKDKRPCLLICPGGGYGFCSEREGEPIALHFLTEGFNVFVLKYSTEPHRFPSQLREVAAALELIYRFSDLWNCDTKKIAIMGFSAGGHLAAHYSTMYDCKEVREVFPDSKKVNGSILCYPVITADEKYRHEGSFVNLLGHKPDSDEEKYFSCDRLVTENTPPAFLWHTTEDTCVPVMNSLLYAKALTENGVPYELHIYPFGGHGLSTCDKHTNFRVSKITEYDKDWLINVKKWLKITLDL